MEGIFGTPAVDGRVLYHLSTMAVVEWKWRR